MRTHTNRRMRYGFTLIEILIVVAILGILSAIIVPGYADAWTGAARSSVLTQLQVVRKQIALYNVRHPATPYGASTPLATFWDSPDGTAPGLIRADYLQSYPENPLQNNSTAVGGVPGGGVGWVWAESSPGDAWTLNIYAVNEMGGWFDDNGDGQPD